MEILLTRANQIAVYAWQIIIITFFTQKDNKFHYFGRSKEVQILPEVRTDNNNTHKPSKDLSSGHHFTVIQDTVFSEIAFKHRVRQGAIPSPFLFGTCISLASAYDGCALTKKADDVILKS